MQVLRLKGIDLLNIFHGVILFYMIILISVDFKRRKTLRRAPVRLSSPLKSDKFKYKKIKLKDTKKIMYFHFVTISPKDLPSNNCNFFTERDFPDTIFCGPIKTFQKKLSKNITFKFFATILSNCWLDVQIWLMNFDAVRKIEKNVLTICKLLLLKLRHLSFI